ncbi:hypothetical protein BT93_F1200 [Corymbia citriodora subsp. variegata]|nr:hypothetical protein BT93_F1200 [Corymbia citriodora subsp. variegata]
MGDGSAQMESGPNDVVPVDFETIQMHNPWHPPFDQMAGASPSGLPLAFREMPEKLLGNNGVVGNDAMDVAAGEELATDDMGIYLELEDLIEKSCGLGDYTSELWEQATGLTP